MPLITDWLMVVITFVYVVATIFICWANIKSAKASKDKYEQGLNDYYKNHGINKTKVDNTNYIDLSKNDDDAR